MKKARKALAMLLVIVLSMAIAVGGTLAYLTDTESAKNTFTVGDIEITLYESAVKTGTNDDGFFSYVDNDGSDRTVTKNTYENLLPGSTICKDPTVTNVGENDAYIRVTIKHNNNDEVFNYFTETEFLNAVVGLSDAIALTDKTEVAWKLANGTAGGDSTLAAGLENNEKVYVLYFKEALAKDETITLFTEINVPETFDSAEMAAFENLVIDIKADAIQANGFDNVVEAFAAFDAQNG